MINTDKVIINTYVENNEGNIVSNMNDIDSHTQIEGNTLNVMYIPELKKALEQLQEECNAEEGRKYIRDIGSEFNSSVPSVGRISGAFNMLKRVCSNKKFLDAVTVFGDLLIKAIK